MIYGSFGSTHGLLEDLHVEGIGAHFLVLPDLGIAEASLGLAGYLLTSIFRLELLSFLFYEQSQFTDLAVLVLREVELELFTEA